MIEPGTIVNCPGIGECFVIRSKRFDSGQKYQIKDMYGRTWHKPEGDLEIVKAPEKRKIATG